MAGSIDPTLRSADVTRAPATSAPDLCGWCFGAGKYLEALDCGVEHVYLPVVCTGCNGSGRRTAAA
ncbi:MAG: hypothetical protein JHC74_14520 [Thermoleophilia bacterium]|nr:hypothetical protein [Thermoleophilia bacterium]